MNNSGDAAEQVVRLSLEGFEVAAKVSGEAAKNIAILLVSALKQESKTKGKARLTNMIKSGKELKVYSINQSDFKTFVTQAKKYGVLYSVLKDRNNKSPNAVIDIIARADDASKIQRIMDKFELGTVDRGTIIQEVEKDLAERKAKEAEDKEFFSDLFEDEAPPPAEKSVPQKSRDEIEIEQMPERPLNPTSAMAGNPLSEQSSTEADRKSNEGAVTDKPSVKKKLKNYKEQIRNKSEQKKLEKSAEKASPEKIASDISGKVSEVITPAKNTKVKER